MSQASPDRPYDWSPPAQRRRSELGGQDGAELTRLTAQRDAFQRLAEERGAALQQIDRASAEFLAVATHDLKSPLTAIKCHSQLLLRHVRRGPPDREMLAHGLATIDAQTTALTGLLDDLLDASRIQSGAIVPRSIPCELDQCVTTVLARLSPGERRRIEVALPTACLSGNWEQRRVEQVLANLIGNALKYSPGNAQVSVTARLYRREIEVAVADHGMGIAAEEQPRLFDRFYRAPQVQATSLPGTGLGLYICRDIVAHQGGRLWCESRGVGAGATFLFTLPIGPLSSD